MIYNKTLPTEIVFDAVVNDCLNGLHDEAMINNTCASLTNRLQGIIKMKLNATSKHKFYESVLKGE